MAADITHSSLNLTPEEKRVFGQLFQQADTEGLQVVTGDVAVKFFERTQLDPQILGAIWQIADTENRGLLTPAGFSVVLRLIGHCQAGSEPSVDLAKTPGPLPKFDGMNITQAPPPPPPQRIQAQTSGGPIRVPPLPTQKVNEYAALFEKAGARNGILTGDAAKQVFEKARLPNEILGRIWALTDTEGQGEFGITQFIVAMHLLASMRGGTMTALPQTLPPALWEAASRRGPATGTPPVTARQVQPPQSLSRAPYSTMSPDTTGSDWLVTPPEKARYDQIFSTIDTAGTGYISGDQAVGFFSNSNLSEDTLASIWDLANIQSEGQLNRDEFAVAMYLIRLQRTKGGDLPTTLPPKLMPPSMRQPSQIQQAFSPPRQNIQPVQRSASEDLFGLDALNESAAPAAQATPQSQPTPQSQTSRSLEDPFGSGSFGSSPAQTQKISPTGQGLPFKPFQPLSSFGQNLATQTTGESVRSDGSSQPRSLPQVQSSGGDDLLGDNDPEVSRKLTDETTELANMSNQISTLRNQMQEVQGKRSNTEREVGVSSTQKQELEQRLAQFRSQYEQEVREIKSLEERLRTSKTETQKLQQEIGMIEGAHGDLKTQHQQLAAALEADQKENAALKEKTRQLNAEISELKPQVEKMRSEARQQKGLVAINKKQVSTSEAEKERLQTEMSDLEKANAERAISPEPVASPPATRSPPIGSPPTSSSGQSMNPFFRKASQQSMDKPVSPPTYGGPSAFDSFFGPSESTPQSAQVPATSFPAPVETSREAPIEPAESTSNVATPVTSPLPTVAQPDVLQTPDQPPPPPEAEQLTSRNLPLGKLERSDSYSSSVKPNPPASRAGFSGNATPIQFSGSPAGSVTGEDGIDTRAPPTFAAPTSAPTSAPTAVPISTLDTALPETSAKDAYPADEPEQDRVAIPGAFPSETITPATPTNRDFSPFGTDDTSTQATSTDKALDPIPATSTSEFPPIQDLQNDDESDSDVDTTDRGFDDDFTTTSPPRTRDGAAETVVTDGSNTTDSLQPPRPEIQRNDSDISSQLPTPTAQSSPPTYDQTVPEARRESNSQFPPEFGQLLPSREMANSPPAGQTAHEPAMAPPVQSPPIGSANGTTSTIPTFASPSEPAGTTTTRDEFDDAFEGLSDAKEGSEADMDDSFISQRGDDHEFNPVFESPAPSKSTTIDSYNMPSTNFGGSSRTVPATDNFNSFEPSFGTSTTSTTQPFTNTTATAQPAETHDFDDIFAGLDNNSTLQSNGGTASKSPFDLPDPIASTSSSAAVRPPPPARAISNGTEHDDPILKSLTGMGYPREEALQALEKYDYNLDKAADYLTSKT